MTRREFITVLASATIAWPLRARAQQSRPLLAILSPARSDAPVLKNVNEPFKQALAKLGWESGRTIDIVERFADGDDAQLPVLSAVA